ncbi:MAG: hypothetical protein RL095_2696 [Verrucomicrobiota bacterium]|jgi:cob(I)alamin adenosyltransferase
MTHPEIRLDRIVTRGGDGGSAALPDGTRLPKDHPRFEAMGLIDELNCRLGSARLCAAAMPGAEELARRLRRIQDRCFDCGSLLTSPAAQRHPSLRRLAQSDLDELETWVALINPNLIPLKSFVLPGATELSSRLHLARSAARSAERAASVIFREELPDVDSALALAWINRLSDWLFVESRAAVQLEGAQEILWGAT